MDEENSGARLLAEISLYRRYVVEILLVVVLVSFTVNYLSAALFEILWPGAPGWWPYGLARWRWLQVGLAMLIVTIATALSLSFVIARQVRQARQIDILLPIVVSTQHVHIRYLPRYHATRRMEEALGRAKWEQSDGQKQFLDAWREGQSAGGRPLRGFALSCVYDLIECVLLEYIGRYGQETLGYQAQFLSGADFAPPVASPRKTSFAQLCGRLPHDNYFFEHDKQFPQRNFHLPAGVKLGALPLPREGLVAEDGDRPVKQMWLKGPYGTLTITPSQVWQRVPKHRQAGRILEKHFPEGPNTEVWGVLVRVALESRFQPWYFFWPPARDGLRHHVMWLTGLADYLQRRVDWNRYIATERGRALVRLEENVDRLLARREDL